MSSPLRRLRVGISLFVRPGPQSVWENGIFQNCIFLAHVLQQCPQVSQVVLVNGGTPGQADAGLMLDIGGVELIELPQAMEQLDLLIEMSALIPEDWVRSFKARGGKLVWMRVGNDYVIDVERAIFDQPSAALVSDKAYDAIWTLPEYAHSCTDYYALSTRAPVRIVPHLWTPLFFDKGISSLAPGARYGYQRGRKRWRVSSFEPNVCMVKTSTIPMLVCEEAYRQHPAFLENFRVYNSLHLKEHGKFVHFAQSLDVVRHGIASFEGRFAVYEAMAHWGDCIISHHWENGQNYLYYEALYGGYPLIHNSLFIKDLGYYYPEFDCQAGGQALIRAFGHHDANLKSYRSTAAALIKSLSIQSDNNICAYSDEINAICHAG